MTISTAEKDAAIKKIKRQLAEWRARQTLEYLAQLDRETGRA